MKKETMKGFLAGVIVMTLIFGTTVTGFAQTGAKTITATYNNIKLYVDQTLFSPKDAQGNTVEPFIYNGTTYLPVRAVSEALRKEVFWDNQTKSVYIGTQPSASSYSRTNPAPVGTAQTLDYASFLGNYNATVTVNSILRGDEAWKIIKSANRFNESAADGYEYILANVTIKANSVKDEAALSVSGYDFSAYSSKNEEYSQAAQVTPSPELSGKIFAGGSKTGNVIFCVKTDDKTPKAVYGEAYDGTGGIWFQLY